MRLAARLSLLAIPCALALAGCAGEAGPLLPPATEMPGPAPEGGLPAPTPAQGSAPQAPTPTAYCLNDAEFMEDLTLPDGTEVLPGAVMDKRWQILNRGGCAWGPGYRLVQIGESRIQGPDELALYPAVAGGQAVWQVELVAPGEEGEFISRWRARAPDGTLFGDEVYVLIVVNAAPLTPTAIPTAGSR